MNIIVRNGDRVYQIKSNAMTSLSTNTTTRVAQFNRKANIQAITNPLASIAIDGNGTLQMNITDRGEPGSSDSIAITLWGKAGGLWFASAWDGTKTVER